MKSPNLGMDFARPAMSSLGTQLSKTCAQSAGKSIKAAKSWFQSFPMSFKMFQMLLRVRKSPNRALKNKATKAIVGCAGGRSELRKAFSANAGSSTASSTDIQKSTIALSIMNNRTNSNSRKKTPL